MKSQVGFKKFKTGIRLAWIPAMVSGAIFFLLLMMVSESVWVSVAGAIVMMGAVFLSVYGTSVFLLRKPLDGIRETIRESSERATQHNEENKPGERLSKSERMASEPVDRDELQGILRDAERNRALVIKEFKRMDETDNYRKEFIGDISHELKTPIFTVQGYLETLLNGALEDPEVNEVFLVKAMKNVNRLIYLTNDLMEISRLETGELKPKIQMIPINSIITDVVDTLQPKAEQEDIEIVFEERKVNAFVLADRNQIRQVLVNLIDNAIKYNKPGGKVYIRTESVREDPSRVRISVRDTGIGMTNHDAKRVTERFFRVDKSRSREQGGTGLGLAIVKHILESHNEELQIESKPGSGSMFYFSLKSADYRSDQDE